MNRMIKYTLIPMLFLGFISTAVAQAPKIGYVNSVLLLQEIPEVKQANANLEALQKQLQKKGESMLQEFQKKYQDLQMKEQQGELSPKQLEEEARKLREEEVKIQQFEQEMRGQLDEKQKTLLQPILDNVSAKIQEVAKENGFTYIIDDSQGILLFKDESMDVTDMVKSKLGLSN